MTIVEQNILEEYGFLTREEYEAHCFEIATEEYVRMAIPDAEPIMSRRWAVRSIVARDLYPKTFSEAKRELMRRGLDPGDETYGLLKVVESGDVAPAGNMWKKTDVDLAMISLAEFGCIEPWVHTCKSFNIKPVEYVKAMRAVAEENLERLGAYAAEPILYRFEFSFGAVYSEPGTLSIALRDDWQQIARQFSDGFADAAQEE